AARWAATLLYRVCQLLVYRELDETLVRAALHTACPEPMSAAVAYSVDLTFRHLPDLMTLVRAAAEQDILVADLRKLANVWPLSSVGMKEVAADDVSLVLDHPAL